MDLEASECLFSFGVIADIQHAEVENRLSFTETGTRYYRNALVLLREAVQYWSTDLSSTRLNFVVQLGDILDGVNAERGKKHSLCVLQKILAEFDELPCNVHHVLGNHEFYNFTRQEVMNSRLFSGMDYESTSRDIKCQCFPDIITSTRLGAEPEPAAYYHFSPYEGFRFVVLDTFDMSMLAHDEACPIYQESLDLVCSVNSNEDLESPAGLVGPRKRFVEYNGAIGEAQMRWLEEVLEKATHAKEKVVVFGHTPVYPSEANYDCLLWNYHELLSLLRSFPCVAAVMTGHTHNYAFATDEWGIHFLELPGIVEVPPGSNGFGTVAVYPDKLVLHGIGEVISQEMPFPESTAKTLTLVQRSKQNGPLS